MREIYFCCRDERFGWFVHVAFVLGLLCAACNFCRLEIRFYFLRLLVFCLDLFSCFIIVSIPSIGCPCNCHACIIRDKSNIVSRSKQIEGYQDVLIARMDATVIYDRLKWRDDCCHNEQTGGCFDLQ